MDKLWKPALAVGGISAIGAFVFYSLYKDWLSLDIFEKLNSNQTFIIMMVFLVLVFLVAVGMLVAWFFDRGRQNEPKGDDSVTYCIPANCSFRQASKALASEDNATIIFKGIPELNLTETLKSQTVKASNTKRAIELLHGLASKEFPPYSVILEDGLYTIEKI